MRSLDAIKRKLQKHGREEIVFDSHSLLRMDQRRVKEGLVVDNLMNPQNLTSFREEKTHNPRKQKFVLHFTLSRSRILYVVVFLTDKLIKVKTSNIDSRRYKKKLRRGRWQR